MKQKLLLYFLCFLALAFKANAQSQKPNIILILVDDIGYKSLTCNGGNLYSTPNINDLAQNGMRFTQCHSTPLCSPSRFLLLTGKQKIADRDLMSAQRFDHQLGLIRGYALVLTALEEDDRPAR